MHAADSDSQISFRVSLINACKTRALGMGRQTGGMRNEMGHWPEVRKKSLQAMVTDMQQGLRPEFFQRYSTAELPHSGTCQGRAGCRFRTETRTRTDVRAEPPHEQ